MQRPLSDLERLFDLDDQELDEKRRELRTAEEILHRAEKTLQEAKSTIEAQRQAWMKAGQPEIHPNEVFNAQASFEAQKALVFQHQRNLQVVQANLTYLRCGKWCREMLESQPWYLFSTLAGGAGFLIFLFPSLLCKGDFRWNIGFAIFGFVVGFVLLAFCQLLPDAENLQRSVSESLLLESAALAGLATATPMMDSAKTKYETLSERFDLKSRMQTATADLDTATQGSQDAKAAYHQVKREYEVTKESCSRKNRLLSNDWKLLRGIEFEEFLAEVFKELGFQVQTTKVTGDHGVDLIIFKHETKIAIQAKG